MADDLEIKLARWDLEGLRVAAGAWTLALERVALLDAVAQWSMQSGTPRVLALRAAGAELSGVQVEGPLDAAHAPEGAWSLAPLATADGLLQAQITDAHLRFDAQVAVPIGRGAVDFNQATVEHVGPDSRMGVSRMGLYVDAPNGRSYLYQFPATPVAGVSFERRGPLPGPWASDRGSLQLQPFVEALLAQGPAGATAGVTGQTRTLLGRTAARGEVDLGDGAFAAPGLHGELAGRPAGRNRMRLQSEAVGRGVTAEIEALSARALALSLPGTQLSCAELSGQVRLKLTQDRAVLQASQLKLTDVRLSFG